MAMGNAADLLAYGGGAAPGTSAKPGNASIDRRLASCAERSVNGSAKQEKKELGGGGVETGRRRRWRVIQGRKEGSDGNKQEQEVCIRGAGAGAVGSACATANRKLPAAGADSPSRRWQ
jgi:hypothetical protein